MELEERAKGRAKELISNSEKTTLIVFSHPNHELAIFGILQRLRPHLLYLTDGGGRERVAETKRGLGRIGLLEQATFLNHSEATFYESLVAGDNSFFGQVTAQVSAVVGLLKPAQVLCDAVEFYNPIHDLSLPIVRAAIPSRENTPVLEVPLVHQKNLASEEYEVQRLPGSRQAEQIEMRLTEEELDQKLFARETIYLSLADQMGPLLSELPRAHTGLEVVAPARSAVPEPTTDQILRYEWRAELLRSRGEFSTPITYSDHYLPIASELFCANVPASELVTR
ncbi:MAG TPA: hypothetical protein VJU86_15840 [Pyrinomonadaceae bacterium]|nr:hypothetical protein [Pyrinomonadaceae bacterium]